MGFRLKSGNRTSFKNMGGTEKSPAKHYVDDVPDHNDGHSDDLQTPEEHEAAKSPAKQKIEEGVDYTKPKVDAFGRKKGQSTKIGPVESKKVIAKKRKALDDVDLDAGINDPKWDVKEKSYRESTKYAKSKKDIK